MDMESGSSTKFSIVIPTYNRASELRQTLASLAKLKVSSPWEVIVVDNGFPETQHAALAGVFGEQGVRFLLEAEPGISPARSTCRSRAVTRRGPAPSSRGRTRS